MSVSSHQIAFNSRQTLYKFAVTVATGNTSYFCEDLEKGHLTMANSNTRPLIELEAEIVELEEEIPDQATRDHLLAIPKRLLAEAQDHLRRGKAREARLTINCACILLERAKYE